MHSFFVVRLWAHLRLEAGPLPGDQIERPCVRKVLAAVEAAVHVEAVVCDTGGMAAPGWGLVAYECVSRDGGSRFGGSFGVRASVQQEQGGRVMEGR